MARRKYRFVTAFNDKIADECNKRFSEIIAAGSPFGKQLSKRVIMQSKRTPAVVFSAFDNFFAPSNSLHFSQVSLSNKSSLSDLAQFYADIYLESFPDENERETFDNLIGYLRNAETDSNCVYHILLAKDDEGTVVGGAVFDYFKRTNCAVIEFIAVKNNLQACGKGTAIYKQILTLLSYDANKNKFKSVDNIFCEIDSPEISRSEGKKYLYFWNKNNYKRLNFEYCQPALSNHQKPVTGLWFTVNAVKTVNSFSADTLLKVLYDYMKYCMQIDNPEENEQFRYMKAQISKNPEVELKKIIE